MVMHDGALISAVASMHPVTTITVAACLVTCPFCVHLTMRASQCTVVLFT